MSDFKEFQRDNARREADAQRRADAEENADLERDDAYERKHQRRGRKISTASGYRRTGGTTPIWHLTAGTWAQLLLSVLWVAVLGLGSGAFTGPQSDAKGWLSIVIFVVGAILGPVTWRVIGQRAREVVRSGLRVGAVLVVVFIVGAKLWGANKRHPVTHASSSSASVAPSPAAPSSAAPSSAAPSVVAEPAPAPPAPAPPEAGPISHASSVEMLRVALMGADEARSWRALDAIAGSHARSRTAYQSARRLPGGDRALANAIARLDELLTLEGPLAEFASMHAEEIERRAPEEHGAQLALRFAAPTRAHVDALVKPAIATRPGEPTTALDSLTILLARGAPLPTHEAVTPSHAAWWTARASTRAKDKDAACRALGDLMVKGSGLERSLTALALRDLSPRCTAAGPVILKQLLAQARASMKNPMTGDEEAHFSWAFNAMAHTGIENAGAVQRFLRDIEKLGGLRGKSNAGEVLDTLFEEHLMHASGVSRLVWNNPAATAGLERPTLTLGPCHPAQVGMKRADEVARLGERPCVTSFEGASLARAPLGTPVLPPARQKTAAKRH